MQELDPGEAARLEEAARQERIQANLDAGVERGGEVILEIDNLLEKLSAGDSLSNQHATRVLRAAITEFAETLEIDLPDNLTGEVLTLEQLLPALKELSQLIITDITKWGDREVNSGNPEYAFTELLNVLNKIQDPNAAPRASNSWAITASLSCDEARAITGAVALGVTTFASLPDEDSGNLALDIRLAATELLMNIVDHQLIGEHAAAHAKFSYSVTDSAITLELVNPSPFEDLAARIAVAKRNIATQEVDLDGERGRGIALVIKAGFELELQQALQDGSERLRFVKKLS